MDNCDSCSQITKYISEMIGKMHDKKKDNIYFKGYYDAMNDLLKETKQCHNAKNKYPWINMKRQEK